LPSRKRALTITLIIFSMLIPIFLLFHTQVGGGAVLHVSLPSGTLTGEDTDPWLNEGWLLNLTGTSQTFTVRINNTSAAKESYDTHLIIALNDAGYGYLENLNVDGTDIPKSAFQNDIPKPYNIWTWPSGDVYPTWFNDTYVNIGTIPPKGYKEVTVSVTFSNATGVGMHFDAYGSSVETIPPTNTGDITRNPLSGDSTVLFQPEAPMPQPPSAQFFYYPSWPNTNETVTFNASASYDPDGYIVSYNWDFGDGTPVVIESEPITTHRYNAFGNYTVTLTIIDNDGLTANSTTIVSVRQHPVASFIFSPTDPLEGEPITFDASASTPDGGTIVSYEWNFGDGNITTASDPIITHTYPTFGNYTVTLNVTDSEGKWDTESKTITVRAPPPPQYYLTVKTEPAEITTILGEGWYDNCTHVGLTAPLYVPDKAGYNGERYVFTHWTVDDNFVAGNPITVHMDANHTATAHYVVQYYLKVTSEPAGVTELEGEGWYNECGNVTLIAPSVEGYEFRCWDVDGVSQGEGAANITVHMNASHTATAHYAGIPPLSVSISPTTERIKIGEFVTFTSTVSAGKSPYSYQWYLNGSMVPDATSPIWTFEPEATGFYIVYLNVTDSLGSIAKSNEALVTVAPKLTVSISPTSDSILLGQSVEFTSTVSGGYAPYSYQWYVNDSPVSGATSASWAFMPTSEGNYYIYLKVTDAEGNIAQSKAVRIVVSAVPVGGYSVSIKGYTIAKPLTFHLALVAILAGLFIAIRRKMLRENR